MQAYVRRIMVVIMSEPQPREPRTISTIRRATPSELPRVAALLVNAYEHDYAPIAPGYLHRLSHPEEHSESDDIWVAVDATGSFLATVSTTKALDADTASCSLLGVAPDARQLGLGTRMLRFCAERAVELGAARLALHSADYMTGAHRLYARFGFSRTPETDFTVDAEPPVEVWGFSMPLDTAAG